MQITLPGDTWVEVKALEDLRDGDRKAVNKAIHIEVDPATKTQIMPGDYNDMMMDALLCQIITNWSFSLPLPGEYRASLDTLTIPQAKALREAVQPYFELVTEKPEVPTSSSGS